MNRFDEVPSVTNTTLSAQLYPDETLVLHQDGVGLYDGKDKSPLHYDGRVHLTSHRIVFVSNSPSPSVPAVQLALAEIKQTEYWSGFLKSSPKITLVLDNNNNNSPTSRPSSSRSSRIPSVPLAVPPSLERSWVCRVCGMNNVPTLKLGLKCSLCGIPHDGVVPSSSAPSPRVPPSTNTNGSEPPVIETGTKLACTVCTFLNHHSMARCEMCDSPLVASSARRGGGGGGVMRPSPPSVPSTPPPSSSSSSSTRPSTPAPPPLGAADSSDYVRLSFRRGGIHAFYAALKVALGNKEWQLGSSGTSSSSSVATALGRQRQGAQGRQDEVDGRERATTNKDRIGSGELVHKSSSGVGIDAILRGIDLTSQTRTDSLEDALKDLESLMKKAKEMIQIAQSINARLSSTSSPTGGGETGSETVAAAAADKAASTLASTSLSSLGLLSSVAVTADQTRSEVEYHHSLARELASLLQPPTSPSSSSSQSRGGGGGGGPSLIDKRGGVIGLDELWCVWNRSRGVALVSPVAFRQAVSYLKRYTDRPQLDVLTFPKSGLTILHDPRYAPRAFRDRLLDEMDQLLEGEHNDDRDDRGDGEEEGQRERGGVGLLDVAKREGLSLGLAKEMVELVEFDETRARGPNDGIVRDAGPGGTGSASHGVRWYRDWITGFEWDGQD